MAALPGEFVTLPDASVGVVLAWFLNATDPAHDFALHLVSAEFTNDPTRPWQDYNEPSIGGYAPVILDRAGWNAPTVGSGCAEATWGADPIQWTNNGAAVTIYGCAYLDAVTGAMLKVHHFPTADVLLWEPGATYTLTPAWSLAGMVC